jgi:tRNA-modifying protein YgfZ
MDNTPERLAAPLAAEYRALTGGWGTVDVSDRTQIEITGTDRAAFLNGFCTNEVQRLQPGKGCETFVTNVKGRTIGHVFVFCGLKSLVVDGESEQSAALLAHLERYLIREDVQFHERTGLWAEWFVGGSEARRGLERLLAIELPATMLEHAAYTFESSTVFVRRVPLATDGYLVALPREAAGAMASRMAAAGAVACSAEALEIVRVEAAMPRFGRDITDQNLPQEVNRDAVAISFAKGCYLGQETVARLDALGHVNRLLVSVRWEAPPVPLAGDELTIGGQRVGQVTSAVWSPYYEAPLALAYVRTPHHATGTALDSATGPARVIRSDS